MPRRGDNTRKRKDGRWEARYILTNGTDEIKKYSSVYGKTYQEVRDKREDILAQGQKEKPKLSALVFRDILAAWQDANRIRLKAASVSRYQNLIDIHILPELGSKRMGQITVSVLNRFITSKLEKGRLDHTGGLSPSYVRSIALIINSAISFGVAEKQAILEKELLQDMSETKLLIYITLYTGIRIGEACALRWEDIDLESNILYVRQTVSRVWTSEDGKKKIQVGDRNA